MKKNIRTKRKSTKQSPTHVRASLAVVALSIILILGVFLQASKLTSQIFLQTPNTQVVASTEDAGTIPTFLRIPKTDTSLVVDQTRSTNEKGYAAFQLLRPESQNETTRIFYTPSTHLNAQQLDSLQKGDTIMLLTQDGTLHVYQVETKFYATFNALAKAIEEGLFLTTQYGFGFQKRLVVKAVLED